MRTFDSMKEFKAYADKIATKYKFIISKYNEDYSIDVDCHISFHSMEDLTELPIRFNIVSGDFSCSRSGLTSLEGSPKYVEGSFWCHDMLQLKSLKGSPEYVKVSYDCDSNDLTSLEGCPKYVGYNFRCCDNNLQSLKGAPEFIGGEWNIESIFKSFPEYQRYLLVKKIEKL